MTTEKVSFPWDEGTVYEEVTEPFLKACSELDLGEILHSPRFSLMQAMSAIELMDPVMDAWVSRPSRKPYNFASAAASGHLKMKDLTQAERLGIVDETLLCLVSWLEGHSLADTVLTNLYLHSPLDVTDPLLSAVSLGFLKLVAIMRDTIFRVGVFEEEDFQIRTFSVNFMSSMTDVQLSATLKEAEEDLQKTIRKSKAKVGEEISPPQDAQENELAVGLLARLRFVRLLYFGLYRLYNDDVEEGKKRLSQALEQIPCILQTLKYGIKREDYEEGLLPGFDPLAIQGIIPRTYFGVTKLKPREPSIIYLKEMVQRLIYATSVTSLTSYHSILDFFMEFGHNGTCVLTRSVLQTLYQPFKNIKGQGNQAGSQNSPPNASSLETSPFPDLLKEACKSFIAPPALINQNNSSECINGFFAKCCSAMGRALVILGHNRARQRDKIAMLLEHFSIVQEEADKLDALLNHGSNGNQILYFSTWLLYHILRFMIRYLLSGFELELYSTHEFTYIYWYLYELLYPWLTSCLFRAETHLLRLDQLNEAQHTTSKNKKKLKNNSKKKSHPHSKEATSYQGYSVLCAGYFKLLVGLKKENQIMVPDPEFDNVKVRYERRFAPFSILLSPPLMPYSQYIEVYNHFSQWDSSQIFSAAAKDFASSRKIFELASSSPSKLLSSEEFTKLVSVAKNNFVVSSILSKDSKRKIDFDFSLHRTFPVIKLV